MKMLIVMTMMMFTSAAAHDVVKAPNPEDCYDPDVSVCYWELTYIFADEMHDLPKNFGTRESCLRHGAEYMTNPFSQPMKGGLLGFICEEVEEDQS